MQAVDVKEKQVYVANYHHNTMHNFLDLVGAMGYTSPNQLRPHDVKRRVADESEMAYNEFYPIIENESLISGDAPDAYKEAWDSASSEEFSPS